MPSLFSEISKFSKPVRGKPHKRIIDEIDSTFFIMFDFEDNPEDPGNHGTCDIGVVPLTSDDWCADCLWLVKNARHHNVCRFFAAIGLSRFKERAKDWFYQLNNPLR